VTKNNETVLYEAGYRNGYNLNPLTRIYERASLVPAAAVIPALKVYIAIAAVKKLVVGSKAQDLVHPQGVNWAPGLILLVFPVWPSLVALGGWRVYFEKIRVLKTGVSPAYWCME
jgi:hypothetical protein